MIPTMHHVHNSWDFSEKLERRSLVEIHQMGTLRALSIFKDHVANEETKCNKYPLVLLADDNNINLMALRLQLT